MSVGARSADDSGLRNEWLSPSITHFEECWLACRQRIIKKGAPFKVGLRRRLGTDGKEHPNGQQKVYWHGRASGKHLDCGQWKLRLGEAKTAPKEKEGDWMYTGMVPGAKMEIPENDYRR